MPDRLPPASLPEPYFLGQDASSVARNATFRTLDPYFAPFLTTEGAERFFAEVAGKVDGLDYVNYWYEPEDAEMALRIAEIGRAHGVDLWAGIRWYKQFRDLPVVPAEYQSWTMEASGRIVPVLWETRNHLFDYLNPAAMDWMLDLLDERYWRHMAGAVNGLFLPECRVPCEVPYGRDGHRSWTLHAYSPYVLDRWRRFCAGRDVRHGGAVVDRFPVPLAPMTGPCPDRTIHVPDDRPGRVPSFTRLSDIPRGTAVWLAWEEFLCSLFHESFVHRIAERANRRNMGRADWRGVCFFNNDVTMLDYRDYRGDTGRTGPSLGYWPQGRRMGVDLRALLADPEVTCFVSETIQSVRDYLGVDENPLAVGMRMAREAGRERDYGFMLHYCDSWGGVGDMRTPGGGIMDDLEEDYRWEMLHRYRPPVFSFHSVPAVLVSAGAWYRRAAAERFWRRVEEYRRSFR